MTAFTIDAENNITFFASLKEIQGSEQGTETFTNQEEFVTPVGGSEGRLLRPDSPSTGDLRRCGALLTTGWALSFGSPNESVRPTDQLTGGQTTPNRMRAMVLVSQTLPLH